jgi:hypothetical protein
MRASPDFRPSPFTRLGPGALVIVTCLCLGNTLSAAMIRGRLLYSNGAAAAQIAVRLSTAQGVSPFTYSGRDGMYYLNGIPAGTYTLEIWRNQVLVSRQPITVHETITDVPVSRLP